MKIYLLCSTEENNKGFMQAFRTIKKAKDKMKELGEKEFRGPYVDYYYTIHPIELT